MYSIVILCIVSVMFNQQARGCNPYRGAEETINKATQTITDLRSYINDLKSDYERKLIEIKINKTERVYEIMDNTIELVKNEMIKVRETGKDIQSCYKTFREDLTRTTIAVPDKMRKCIENNINILESVEKDIEDFLKDRKSCLLNLDLLRVQACRVYKSEKWKECVDEHLYHVSINGNGNPYTCNYQKYILKQKELEKTAFMYSLFGLTYVSQCIAELETKYNSTIQELSRDGLQCIKNSEHSQIIEHSVNNDDSL